MPRAFPFSPCILGEVLGPGLRRCPWIKYSSLLVWIWPMLVGLRSWRWFPVCLVLRGASTRRWCAMPPMPDRQHAVIAAMYSASCGPGKQARPKKQRAVIAAMYSTLHGKSGFQLALLYLISYFGEIRCLAQNHTTNTINIFVRSASNFMEISQFETQIKTGVNARLLCKRV